MLLQVKENQDLRESLLRNEKKCFETKLELWNKEREL